MTEANSNRKITNPLVGDELTFLTLSSESDGKHSIVEVYLQPNGGSEPHFHIQLTERFTAISGTLGVQVADQELRLEPGESYTVQPNITHKYFNPTDEPIRFQVEITPGHQGFEQFLQIAYGLAEDGLTTATGMPKNPLHTAVFFEISDTNLPGAIRIIEPIIRFFGLIAKRRNTKEKLIQQYCRIS